MKIEVTVEDDESDDLLTMSYRVTVKGRALGARNVIRKSDLIQESIFEIVWESMGRTLRDELKKQHHKDGG